MEVNQPRVELNVRDEAHAQMRTRDVLREANAQLQNHMNSYDKKIKDLMSEVGSLKNEVIFTVSFCANLNQRLSAFKLWAPFLFTSDFKIV